ncbi:MAG: hypothetical protein ACMUEL_02435 [Flavobacteriales bacterium Tduv]
MLRRTSQISFSEVYMERDHRINSELRLFNFLYGSLEKMYI